MSKKKTYKTNRLNIRKEDFVCYIMYKVYEKFCEVENYCYTHLDDDLSHEEHQMKELFDVYDHGMYTLKQTVPGDMIAAVWQYRWDYMHDAVMRINY